MKRIGATERKLLRTLRLGKIDSLVSLAQLSGIRFGIVLESMPTLLAQGYVRKTDSGYEVKPKGQMMADASQAIRAAASVRRPKK